ncbi:MAG: hypothetical protein LBD51_05620, partial [Bifidobacteriaceae bacterium]|nr:hypothetical protein [Bifidobacteriaceae bacterium]
MATADDLGDDRGWDGAGAMVSVGAVFAGPDADPEWFASRDRRVVEAAVAESVRGLVVRAGRDAPPVADGDAAGWLGAAERSVSGVWFDVVDLAVEGLAPGGGEVSVAALVDAPWEVCLLAAADRAGVEALVAETLAEGLGSKGAGWAARVFLDEHGGPPLKDPAAAPGWIEAYQRSFGRPKAHFGTAALTRDSSAQAGAGVATALVEMPRVWEELEGSPVAEMVSEVFGRAPARGGYPAGARGEELWEDDMEVWRGQALELASAVANLPDILDRLDLLEHQNSVLARRLAADPLPGVAPGGGVVGAAGWRGLGERVGEFAAAVARRERAVARWAQAVRPTAATSAGMRDSAEEQARGLAAALAGLVAPAGPDGRSSAERGLGAAGRAEVARLVAAGRAGVEVAGVDQPECRYRGEASQAWRRLPAGWYEATSLDGQAPVALVVGRDPVSGRMASGAYELDSAAVALLAPVRGLADQAARGASGP